MLNCWKQINSIQVQGMSKRNCKIQKAKSIKNVSIIDEQELFDFDDLSFTWKRNQIFDDDSFSQDQNSFEQTSVEDVFLEEHQRVLKRAMEILQQAKIMKKQNESEYSIDKSLINKNQNENVAKTPKIDNIIAKKAQISTFHDKYQHEKQIQIKKSESKIISLITKMFPQHMNQCVQLLTTEIFLYFTSQVRDTKKQGDIMELLIYQIQTFSEKIRSKNWTDNCFENLSIKENQQLFNSFLLKWSYTILIIREGYFENVYYDGQRRHFYIHEDQQSVITTIGNELQHQQFVNFPSKRIKRN